jgi:hypothetical protein
VRVRRGRFMGTILELDESKTFWCPIVQEHEGSSEKCTVFLEIEDFECTHHQK